MSEPFDERCACKGAATLPTGEDMEECLCCGTAVRWDLVDHPFWGFKAGCDKAAPSSEEEHPNAS